MSSTADEPARVGRQRLSYTFDATTPPAVRVRPGDRVRVETADARGGTMFAGNPVGSLVELPPPPRFGNPMSGPIEVGGALPGDALVVAVEQINCESPGWVGAHFDRNAASPGRIPTSLARICQIDGDTVRFSEGVSFPSAPVIGCIGVAPSHGASSSAVPGRHGGNLDHPLVREGARVRLPVAVAGAMLYVGDVHAAQGEGELSGSAVEVAGSVLLRVDVDPGQAPGWPWVTSGDRTAVMTCGGTFEEARRHAVDAMLEHIESRLRMKPAEALALISAVGDLRIGQALGGMPVSLRLELPSSLCTDS